METNALEFCHITEKVRMMLSSTLCIIYFVCCRIVAVVCCCCCGVGVGCFVSEKSCSFGREASDAEAVRMPFLAG